VWVLSNNTSPRSIKVVEKPKTIVFPSKCSKDSRISTKISLKLRKCSKFIRKSKARKLIKNGADNSLGSMKKVLTHSAKKSKLLKVILLKNDLAVTNLA